jgi:hypothetical protein
MHSALLERCDKRVALDIRQSVGDGLLRISARSRFVILSGQKTIDDKALGHQVSLIGNCLSDACMQAVACGEDLAYISLYYRNP